MRSSFGCLFMSWINCYLSFFGVWALSTYSCCRMNREARSSCNGLKDVGQLDGTSCSTFHHETFEEQGSLWQPVNFDDDMCRIDDHDDLVLGASTKFTPILLSSDCTQVWVVDYIFINYQICPRKGTYFFSHMTIVLIGVLCCRRVLILCVSPMTTGHASLMKAPSWWKVKWRFVPVKLLSLETDL